MAGAPGTGEDGLALRDAMLAAVLLVAAALPSRGALAKPLTVLFVGNSFTHGRYLPVRGLAAGYGVGPDHVHDDNCLDPARCTEAGGGTGGTREYGPFGGIPGIVLRLARAAGLDWDVSINAVSSATLARFADTPSRVAAMQADPLTGRPFDVVVLQEQSFTPLPPRNALGRATRGDPERFVDATNSLVGAVLAADAAAGRAPARIYLYETQPLAAYTYASPLLRGRSVRQPYLGAPIEAMARDLHDAYAAAAAQNPAITGVAYAGDAWVAAIRDGVAARNPFLPAAPGVVDLWDSDVAAACCTTPIGYHPGTDGAFLSALVLFRRIAGADPGRPGGGEGVAAALGIPAPVARALQGVAARMPASGDPPVMAGAGGAGASGAKQAEAAQVGAAEAGAGLPPAPRPRRHP